ncbi:MAG: hypothetical protein AAF942_05140 [Pseudomonadota bacterium]
MTMSSRSPKRVLQGALPENVPGIDRLFGCDLRSKGWGVDLAGAGTVAASGRDRAAAIKERLDPAMIWVMRNRRR